MRHHRPIRSTRSSSSLALAVLLAIALTQLTGVADARPTAKVVHGKKLRSADERTTPHKKSRKSKKPKRRKPVAPTPAVPTGLRALTVVGNAIVRDGRPFRFRGVNRDTLEWGKGNYGGCGGDRHFADADFDAIRAWGTTAVRLPLAQQGWLGPTCPGAEYVRAVDDAVAKINARGMYAILDLHWTDVQGANPCGILLCLTGQQPMPDADSLVFWRQVAARYANAPGVVFDLFNEPHDVSWGCWRDGGCMVTPAPLTGGLGRYAAVGMQQLVDAVRGTGARNLVLAAGLSWGYDLSGVGAGHALRGANIAYATHVYTLFHATVADWERSFGDLTDTHPVVATEFGSNDCSAKVTGPLLRYFDAPRGKPANAMSWTAWTWANPGNCLQPSVIADWSGTPLGEQGRAVRAAILAAAP